MTTRLDIISDVVCPWCYLGAANLLKAIDDRGGAHPFALRWRPYQLDPSIPAQGLDRAAYMRAKFGDDPTRIDAIHARLAGMGSAVGITYQFDRITRAPNTLDAHRLIHWAGVEDREMQNRVVSALFKANFEEGRNVGDRTVILDIAEAAGLDRALTDALLTGDADKAHVTAEIEAAKHMGVNGVPFFIFDQQYAVSGAQTPDVLAGALRDIARMKAEARSKLN